MQEKSQFPLIIDSTLQELHEGSEHGKRDEWEQIFRTLKWHQTMVASVHSNCSPFRACPEFNQSPILNCSLVPYIGFLCQSSH